MMPQSWNRIFITLVPKKENLKHATDSRPISLYNITYKLVAKVLVNKLQLILPSLIFME